MMTRLKLSWAAALLSSTLLVSSACAKEERAQAVKTDAVQSVQTYPAAPEVDWRELDLENTLYITTNYGVFVIEMAPEFAPKHVAQIKTLARQKFYDDITFHRVIDGFMNQTGDPRGDGTGDSSLPDMQAEFTFRRSQKMYVSLVGQELSQKGIVDTGFYKSFPIATKPISQAMLTKDGKVDAWALHCPGTTSMARGGNNINSGNSQFFLMRAEKKSLDTLYSIWGMTVWGREHLTRIKVGTIGETQNFVPDVMLKVRVAADVPEAERIPIQVMKTDGAAFEDYLNGLKTSIGKLPSACNITVPTRLKP